MPRNTTQPHYVPLPEDDEAIVRSCLREFAKGLQQVGEIPAEVSEAELYAEIETHVPHFVKTVRSSPLYPHLKVTGHTEEHIRQLIAGHF